MELSLCFENNDTGHRDLILNFGGRTWLADTYYLALDCEWLPEWEDGEKMIRAALRRLLEQWLAAV